MSKIERYAGNLRAFGSNAQGLERTLFGETTQADDLTSQVTNSFLRGWGIVGPSENPSMEDFNAAMYTMSQFIAYQHQMGIPEWDDLQEYYSGSICVRNGEAYLSLVDSNIGSAPPSAKWTSVLTAKNALANISGFLKSSNNLSEIKDAGPTAVAQTLLNLGLGDAAKLGVATNAQMAAGTSTALLPTVAAVMSLFSKRSFGMNDYIRIPDVPGGLIIQMGSYTPAGGDQTFNLPIAFTGNFMACVACMDATGGTYGIVTTNRTSLSTFRVQTRASNGSLSPTATTVISIGN
ncbi:gp53-like domain-containing protein [Yersinia mollaretii]|uniref:gp53-like domain-containing protein n=1 Tax=Yersinia mollaretii TaxID=33060 RepID=UPI00061C6941|nr:bacteriophage tail fiber protein [Yersinia mollaretii]